MISDPKPLPRGQKLRIFTDGGSRGNPGPAGFSILFLDEQDNFLFQHSEYLGQKTNNQAELLAIEFALGKAIACTRGEVQVFSDSNNAISWLNGNYRVKHPNIKPLFEQIQIHLSGNRFKKVEFFHVPRDNSFIKICDHEYNSFLDTQLGKK